jgi:hypothetical protein
MAAGHWRRPDRRDAAPDQRRRAGLFADDLSAPPAGAKVEELKQRAPSEIDEPGLAGDR